MPTTLNKTGDLQRHTQSKKGKVHSPFGKPLEGTVANYLSFSFGSRATGHKTCRLPVKGAVEMDTVIKGIGLYQVKRQSDSIPFYFVAKGSKMFL